MPKSSTRLLSKKADATWSLPEIDFDALWNGLGLKYYWRGDQPPEWFAEQVRQSVINYLRYAHQIETSKGRAVYK